MTRKKRIAIIFLIILIAAGGVFAYKHFNKKEDSDQKFYSQLTGKEVSKELANRPVLGIMIENSEAARPQTGLDSAGIVFETVTEGGITRYLALYQEDQPEEVGPVRSLRPYFVDWLMGFDASVAHVGGSAEALELVKSRDTKSLSQFTHSEPYYRSTEREAPHNMYARTKDLRELQQELNYKKSEFKEIPRSDDTPNPNQNAPIITINYSSQLYQVQFRYDQATNSYTRYLAGEPHIDAATDKAITVKNIVVLKMSGTEIDATGNGEALVFKDGTVQTVRWKKTNYSSRVEIIDNQGAQVALNRGDTWISGLPSGKVVDY